MSSVHWPGSQPEFSTADHIVDRFESAWRLELVGCAERVACRQSQQAASEPAAGRSVAHASASFVEGSTQFRTYACCSLVSGERGCQLDFFYASPPLGDLAECFVSGTPVSHQPTTDHRAGPADSTPAVDVNGLAVIQCVVDGVEDRGHLLGPARDRGRRLWGVVHARRVRPSRSGFLLSDFGVGAQFVSAL